MQTSDPSRIAEQVEQLVGRPACLTKLVSRLAAVASGHPLMGSRALLWLTAVVRRHRSLLLSNDEARQCLREFVLSSLNPRIAEEKGLLAVYAGLWTSGALVPLEKGGREVGDIAKLGVPAVSYTHLTLPTILLV